jgi:hypothetical protein
LDKWADNSWPIVAVLPIAIFTGFVTLFVVGVFGGIFAKRIFMPRLEDYEESRKKARYTAF